MPHYRGAMTATKGPISRRDVLAFAAGGGAFGLVTPYLRQGLGARAASGSIAILGHNELVPQALGTREMLLTRIDLATGKLTQELIRGHAVAHTVTPLPSGRLLCLSNRHPEALIL